VLGPRLITLPLAGGRCSWRARSWVRFGMWNGR